MTPPSGWWPSYPKIRLTQPNLVELGLRLSLAIYLKLKLLIMRTNGNNAKVTKEKIKQIPFLMKITITRFTKEDIKHISLVLLVRAK